MSQSTTEFEWLQAEILKRGYAEFDHGIPPDDIDNLVEQYARFTLELPDPDPETMDRMLPEGTTAPEIEKRLDDLDRTQDTQKYWHKYRTNTPQAGKPTGYSNRTFQAQTLKDLRGIDLPDEDGKEFYHFTPRHSANMARLHHELGWGAAPPEVARLDSAFAGIHAKAAQLMLEVCKTIEETHPEIGAYVTRSSLGSSPVRLLYYHPSDRPQLAGGHYDKSVTTLQITESHHGLRVSPDCDTPLQPVIRDDTKAVFFPGKLLRERYPNTVFQPGWHDVVADEQLSQGRTIPPIAQEVCARYAIIFFANGENYVNPDKSETHVR